MKRQLSVNLLALAFVLPTALSAAPPVERAKELVYPPLPSFSIPQPERVVLANGLVVLLLEDHELPLVRVTALVRAGDSDEPVAQLGLAQLAAEVMRTGGSGERTADPLDDYLADKAAILGVNAGPAFTTVTLNCLKADFPELLPTFADMLRRPLFPEDRLEIAKTAVYADIARQNDDTQGIVFRELAEIVYGQGSPWARTPTFASAGGITRDDLVTWHRERFHPGATVLGLVGDFDRAAALALVEKALADWPRKEVKTAAKADPAPTRPAIYFVEKNDVTQSNIALGALGIRKDNPDYYAIELMNQVMSGGFASRLFSTIRTKKGLAYGVAGDVGSAYDHPGMTLFWLSTKTETTGAAIDALLEEIRGMASRPPTEQEVAGAKAAILNSFIFRSDSNREILQQQLTYELYGYPRDWMARYRAGIEKTTAAEVAAAAKKYLHADQLALLVVGPAQGLDKPLASYGQVETRDITIAAPPATE